MHGGFSFSSLSRADDAVEQDGVHVRLQDDFDYGAFLGQNRITEGFFQFVRGNFPRIKV